MAENEALRAKVERLMAEIPKDRRDGFAEYAGTFGEQMALPLERHYPVADFAAGAGADIPLPQTLEDIAESIGRYSAVRLSEGLPQSGDRVWRRSVYVPQRLTAGHRLVEILGADVAARLAWSHANMILEVPVCAEIRRAYRATVARRLERGGASVPEIAAELAVSQETAEDLLRRAPQIPHEGKPVAARDGGEET